MKPIRQTNKRKVYQAPKLQKLSSIRKNTKGPNAVPGSDNRGYAQDSEVS